MPRKRRTASLIESLESRKLLSTSGLPVRFGGPTFDTGVSVASAPDGSTIEGGIFSGTATFGTGSATQSLTSVGETDVFVARYSASGVLQWVRQFGGEGGLFQNNSTPDLTTDPERTGTSIEGPGVNPPELGETIGGVAADSTGNVFFTGSFYGTVTFTDGTTSKTLTSTGKFGGQYPDIYLIKLSSTGQLGYFDQMGGSFTDIAKGITVDSSGNPHITGYFSRTADFAPGSAQFIMTSHGRSDSFAADYSGTNGALIWATQFGSNNLDRQHINAGNAIAVDSSGNTYVTGTFTGTAIFGPTNDGTSLQAVDDTDEFIEKLDSSGNLVWIKQIGGTGNDGGVSITIGPKNTIYTLSYFENTINAIPNTNHNQSGPQKSFKATPDNPGEDPTKSDLLIEKLTTDGGYVWAKQISGAGWETGGGIAVDHSGNAYITGSFYGPTDFNFLGTPQVINSRAGDGNFKDNNDTNRVRSYDIFVEKLSTNGKYVFTKTIGGGGDDYATGIAMTQAGNFLLTGRYHGTVNFDPSPTGPVKHLIDDGYSDGFIVELTPGGGLA